MNTKLNKLLKKIFKKECYLVDSNLFYKLEFPGAFTINEFEVFAEDCRKLLSQYGIETGSTAFHYKPNKTYVLQIKKLPLEEFLEKLEALSKDTQLYEAVKQAAVLNVKMPLDKGANVNNKNIDGEIALHIAARMGHDGVIDILLEQGASVNSINNAGETPLHIVAQTNHLSSLKKILASPEIDVHSKDKEGNTALHLAARVGNPEIMDKLLQAGIDIESNNQQGETPLFSAVYATTVSAIEFLLEKGADNHQDKGSDVAIKTHKRVTFLQRADQEEVAKGVVEITSGGQKVRNIIQFFSPKNSANEDKQLEEPSTAINLGK